MRAPLRRVGQPFPSDRCWTARDLEPELSGDLWGDLSGDLWGDLSGGQVFGMRPVTFGSIAGAGERREAASSSTGAIKR